MQKIALIASLLVLSAFSLTTKYAELQVLWNSWKNIHEKSYTRGEDAARFAIFVENYKYILKFNADHDSPKLGLNIFADLTLEEYKAQRLNYKPRSNKQPPAGDNLPVGPAEDVPTSVDWRKKKAVTPVNLEGNCGSCWVFSISGILEGMYAIKTKHLIPLSGQQLIDCDTSNEGCNGGGIDTGLQYAAQYGLEPASDYPYTGEDDTCYYNASKAIKVNTGYVTVTPNNETAFKAAIAIMPTAMVVDGFSQPFQLYKSGVIKDCNVSIVDHSALAVGYEVIDGVEAYIIKNSWGTSWGEHGYAYISTDPTPNNGTGECGILTESWYAK